AVPARPGGRPPLAGEPGRPRPRRDPVLPLRPAPPKAAGTDDLLTEAAMALSLRTALATLLLLTACTRAQPVPEEAPPLPVKLARLERASFQPTLVLLGVMRPSGEAEVLIPVAGRLHYPARFRDGLASGLPVRSGEVLAQVANPEAEQELGEARLRLASARSELDRYQRAFDSGVVPAAQLA